MDCLNYYIVFCTSVPLYNYHYKSRQIHKVDFLSNTTIIDIELKSLYLHIKRSFMANANRLKQCIM